MYPLLLQLSLSHSSVLTGATLSEGGFFPLCPHAWWVCQSGPSPSLPLSTRVPGKFPPYLCSLGQDIQTSTERCKNRLGLDIPVCVFLTREGRWNAETFICCAQPDLCAAAFRQGGWVRLGMFKVSALKSPRVWRQENHLKFKVSLGDIVSSKQL